jgi:general nucleoside transport system permease protein
MADRPIDLNAAASPPAKPTGPAVLPGRGDQPEPGGGSAGKAVGKVLDVVIRSVVPVVLALIAGAIMLLALGRSPVTFYSAVWQYGIEDGAWQDSAIAMAPLLLIATGLTVVFRANIWNLGYNGQFLIGAALVAGFAPRFGSEWPAIVVITLMFLIAAAAGAAWTIVPAVLKARYGTNEIITTLMMSFIGIDVANILVKGPFQDPTVNIPQTRLIPYTFMLPSIPGTRIHDGVLVALVLAVVVQLVMTRTAFGLRLQILGANPRAADHVGVNVSRMIITSFLISGALVGTAAAADILGLWGYVRANWNPAYGDTVIPFIFLARLNSIAVIPFVAFYAVLQTGGDLAVNQVNLPTDFMLVLVALILLFMTVIEYFGRRRALGTSYLTPGFMRAIRAPLFGRREASE